MEPKGMQEEKIPQNRENPVGNKEPDLQVEIRQYQTLLDILKDPLSTLKVIAAIVILALAIFMALAFTTIAIKRFYPYNEIKTNAFGATTMQNEEVELTYWLFNTADLWANSGIRVERGDILTIRASGKSNTSIHHLVDNAFYNARPHYRWVGTEGEPRPANTRTAYRIYSERDPDALIMQVIPEDRGYNNKKLKEEYFRPDFVPAIKGEEDAQSRFYYIGKERTNLLINQKGTLHFAVNDIVLTAACIDSMVRHNDALFRELSGEEEYVKLLLLKNDSTALDRLIERKGTLHFAVNDIVLTTACIDLQVRHNDALFRGMMGEKEYKELLLLKNDSTALDPLIDRQRPSKCPKGEKWGVAVWKSCCDQTDDELLSLTTDVRKYLCVQAHGRRPYVNNSLWRTGAEIIALRRECDSIAEFYRYLKNNRRYDKDDSTYGKIGDYLKYPREFLPEIGGETGSERCSNLFKNPEMRDSYKTCWKSRYEENQKKLTALLNSEPLRTITDHWRAVNRQGLNFGPHPIPLVSGIEAGAETVSPLCMNADSIQKTIYPFYNEMTFYRQTNYYDAWYEDNVGSFLIVVEKRKNSAL